MSTNQLKAWVRFDGNNNVVPGSLILRRTKPPVGTWLQVTYNLCCGPSVNPNVPTAPLYIYDFQIECENFCSLSIEVNGEPFPFPICEFPLSFTGFVELLQSTFPDATITGIPATPPATGGTITMISSTQVFGTIVTENCGSVTPIVSGLDALRFGFIKFDAESKFIQIYTKFFIELGQTFTDPTTVNAWNEYFDLPANGTPFTGLYLTEQENGEIIELIFIGGANITLTKGFFEGVNTLFYILDDGGFITSVDDFVFSNYAALNHINLPACTLIGEKAFQECGNLITISCPAVLEIKDAAFAGAPTSYLYFPLVTDIGTSAFFKCDRVQTVNISSAINLGDGVFEGCTSLISLDMSSVINLGATYTCADNEGNDVFRGIGGNSIIVRLPVALTTCNAGSNQRDLGKLIENNTVTLITT